MDKKQKTFKEWIITEIRAVLTREAPEPPFLVWCDPRREWLELLRGAANGFELWADPSEHELIIRDRFYRAPRVPRVIYFPCTCDEISWFKVFAIDATAIWEKSLIEALREYGVNIPREHERELISLLPAHAREWFDKPKSTWKELTPGIAKGTLVDDHRMLEVIAGESGEFDKLNQEEKFTIFSRRAIEDFGLPDPTGITEKNWRVGAMARLLATEAAHSNPHNPPSEGDNIISAGLARDNALRLLKLWQSHIQFIPSFESRVQEADKTLGLLYWAKTLSSPPRSYSSRVVEEALFNQTTDRMNRIEEVGALAKELEQNLQMFQDRAASFWGSLATNKVGWAYLVQLAEVACLLAENAGLEDQWKTAGEAFTWYTDRGWMLDQAGEMLFVESPDLPKQMHNIRARLRRGYLRKVDHVGCAFSDLLAKSSEELFSLPTAGELALKEIEQSKAPVALIFLDACSLQLGHRLSALINMGEPTERASIKPAVAPVPSTTALGMAFALPMTKTKLCIDFLTGKGVFQVTAKGFDGNLTIAEQRRRWLKSAFGVKDFLTISDVLDSDKLKTPSKVRRLIVVESLEVDQDGHDGQLQLTGASDHLERYAQAIRKLRTSGYNHIVVVTDHGFFHWQPDADEVEDTKPGGEVFWVSRRAVVGRNLQHKSAVHLPVPCSDLEVMVPRSVNAFRTYGGLGYFHYGATLQELIVPVIIVHWPTKAAKVPIVLKPVGNIAGELPRIQLESGIIGQGSLFAGSTQLARRVVVKVREPASGKLIFRHPEPIIIEPGGDPVTVQLRLVEPRPTISYGTPVMVEVLDADDEELLTREEVILKVDIDEW